ncbi:MAG TPA: polymerase [Cyanobacteria bacterium UBA8553]|nr:polymerase [Cyanobacteria bacterium UBA8553]HAJ64537.1 polymerase [Cyanobacteria bacterium UBA8543]
MRKLLKFAEHAFTVVSLMHYSGGPLLVILSGGANEGDAEGAGSSSDNSLILLLFFVIYLVTFFLLVLRWKKVLYVLSKDRFLLLLIAFVAASMLWSANPSKTLSRSIALIGTTLFGLYLASRYSMKQQLKLFGWMYGLSIILSFGFAVAMPKFGLMGGLHAGKWRGIYNHKNTLGKVIVPGIFIFFLLALGSRKRRRILWCGFGLAVLLLLLSTSKTSLVNLLVVFVAFAAFQIVRWRYHRMIPALTALTTVGTTLYVWMTANTAALLGSLGKDETLTGRGDLWPLVFEKIGERPWLGYGYGAFWNGLDGESSSIWYASGWKPPNSHNGFLDIVLSLGLVGLAILAIGFLIVAVPRALLWVRQSKTPVGFWPVLYMTYLVLANLGESTLMIQNDIFWVFYTSMYFSVLMPPEEVPKVLSKYDRSNTLDSGTKAFTKKRVITNT